MGQDRERAGRSPVPGWLLIGGLVGVAIAVRAMAGPRTIDDAYITFRYARNLAQGLGFVYTPGQAVLGTTTPLYTVVMALAWLVGLHDLPAVALGVNAVADAGTAVLLYGLARRLVPGTPLALAAGLAWAVSPMSVTFAVGGMETSVVIVCMTGSFVAYVAGRPRLAAAAMALAILTRPDALIAAALLWADMGLRPLLARGGDSPAVRLRRLPWAEVATFVAVLAPWIVFAWLYYGTPLPQSVQAKVRVYHLDEFSALIRWLQHLSTPFFEHEVLGRFWPAAGLVLYLSLYAIGCLRLVRLAGRMLPLMLYPVFYVAVFSAANPLIFRWYLAPLLPAYFLGILAGLDGIIRDVARGLRRTRAGGWALGIAAALLLASSLSAYTLHPDHGPDRPAPEMAWFKQEMLYGQSAAILASRLQPGDTIAIGDIGIVGWLTNARILDTVGLVSPEALPYYPLDPSLIVTNCAMAPDLIRDYEPDFLVALEVYIRKTLLPAAWFTQEYRLIQKLETDLYGSDGLLIFERVE